MHGFIDPALQTRIHEELASIERDEAIRILLAVESGSRGWGFPSPDSDYDVRFLYVRPIDAYLAVTPPRDVIERPVDSVLDIGGWDLRKALQLMLRSNAVLIEWLTSPVRYRSWARADELLVLARSAANPTALTYHYQHQARRSFDPAYADESSVRTKSYCYALRSALAIAWLRQHGKAPPMAIGALMAGLTLPDGLIPSVHRLIADKLVATEDATTTRRTVVDAFIADALSLPAAKDPSQPRREVSAQADSLLASVLLDRTVMITPKAGSACS